MTSIPPEYLILLRSKEKEDRRLAAEKLGELGPAAIEAVRPLLNDPEWRLRYRAAEIIGFTSDPSGIPLLTPLLSDEKDHVRYMAVKSLGRCGTIELEPIISPMLNDENPFVRRITVGVLSGWKI
ncbi:PBS lyase HEAT domain protein repeat-containing protein [Methanocorpusculum labreanum Z]|uniref:PBS lyase HEAT domain protein repeat-containing protein n=1 Tax=Methanocorpusculum labreanum (strain ATCC 43576 / DSM 4855 / Z) TaxID=410358 RepID=A2SQT5_METLZ|nr:HEAT repeat domain-containing protein [Methanocorpusculum labreanum]ABN06691.1 PBS lyase HEAT domain protein repeat-containing protein [Methanocorpusculum labreanum Z]